MDPANTRAHEEAYLAQVIAAIEGDIVARGGSVEQVERDLRDLDSTDYNARNRIFAQAGSLQRNVKRLAQQRLNPYFGRIDFDDLKDNVSERIYLGSMHIRHKGRDYVHDWRAPVGELFYQTYGGRTTYRAPSGIIPVNIHLKRRLTIKDAMLIDIADTFDGSDPDPTIGDALLAEMLKRSAGTNMGQIVRSIQAEQDAVIRTRGDIVIVQGPAGSGKTVVALHRAAYLLYQMRQSADPKQYALATASSMRVFSPNRVFAEYISHVLPDLQEDAIEQNVFEDFLLNQLFARLREQKQLSRFKIQRKDEHFEAMLAASDSEYDSMIASCREKTSAPAASAIKAFLLSEEAAVRTQILAAVETAAGESKPVLRLADILSRFDPDDGIERPILGRLQSVIAYVKDETVERQQQLRQSQRAPSRQGLPALRLSASQQEALSGQTTQLTALGRALNKVAKEITGKSLIGLYRGFWQAHAVEGETAERIKTETLEALDKGRISYEDIPALVCLDGYYRSFPSLKGTIHAIVDECQDYTPLHYEFLKQCLPKGCLMTVVGDLNQTVDETVSLGSYDSLAEIFPGRTKRLDLTRSYRSSMEITRFASEILGSGAHIDNVRRSGRLPEVIGAGDANALIDAIDRVVREMQGREYRQIAIVCKSRADAQRLYNELHPKIGGSLLTADADHIAEGVVYVPIAQAKGLEFDAVIVHDAGAHMFSRPADRRLLYTASTRALHELALLYTGILSPLVPGNTALYTRSDQPSGLRPRGQVPV